MSANRRTQVEEQNRSVAIEDAVEAEAAGPGPAPLAVLAVPPGAELLDVIQHCSFTSFPSPRPRPHPPHPG